METADIISIPDNSNDLLDEMRSRNMSGNIKGEDPSKIYVEPHPRNDDPMSRFQSMKKFKDDCFQVKGKWMKPIATSGTTIIASCNIPKVSEVTIEKMTNSKHPYKDNFGSVKLGTKEGRISVIGYAGMSANRYESGIHFLDKKNEDDIIIQVDNRPRNVFNPDLQPSKYYDASISSTHFWFKDHKRCMITAFATPANTGWLNPSWEPYRAIFHSKNAKRFNPNLATIETVRTSCSI